MKKAKLTFAAVLIAVAGFSVSAHADSRIGSAFNSGQIQANENLADPVTYYGYGRGYRYGRGYGYRGYGGYGRGYRRHYGGYGRGYRSRRHYGRGYGYRGNYGGYGRGYRGYYGGYGRRGY